MKSQPTINLIANQIKNRHQSGMLVKYKVKHDKENISIPELATQSYSLNESAEDSGIFEKRKLHIKNMVSIRCKMVVKSVLEKLGLNFSAVELGEVEVFGSISDDKLKQLKSDLSYYGLELLEDRKFKLVEKIKNIIVEMIHYEEDLPEVKYSVYLRNKLNNEYTYIFLSTHFAEITGTTIEHFIITHKIEHAKELILYNSELSLSDIAWKLHYSSVAHLCNQFKQMTGLTPSFFKRIQRKRRTNTNENRLFQTIQ